MCSNDFTLRLGALGGAFRWLGNRVFTKGAHDLASASDKRILVCPAGKIPAITPFMWPAHSSRIRGGPLDLTLDDIRKKLNRNYFYFSEVEAFTLRDVWLLDGTLYHRRTYLKFREMHVKMPGFLPLGPVGEIDCAALASTMMGAKWWGHWVLDDIPFQILAERFGIPVMYPRSAYFHEPGFRDLLSLPSPHQYGVLRCKEMVICSDHASNPDKTKRFFQLRSRFSHFPDKNRRVYIRRGGWGKRRALSNEDDLVSVLVGHGFIVVDTEGRSVEEIVSECKGAETVVSVEGSHMVLALFCMQFEGQMILLNPPFRVDTIMADIGLFFGLRAGMFICEPVGNSVSDFYADPEEVLRFIDDVVSRFRHERGRMDGFIEAVLKQA